MTSEKAILVDLERSIRYGYIYYWKPLKRGYTTSLDEAGRYPKEEAEKIVAEDYDRRTVAVPDHVIDNILI